MDKNGLYKLVNLPLSQCAYNRFTPQSTVYTKKYEHGFVVLCFVVVMQSFIMNSHEVFIHIHQGCFAGTGAIVRLPQCQWSKPDGYGKISQCITTTKHSKAKTVCIFLWIYCMSRTPAQFDGMQYVFMYDYFPTISSCGSNNHSLALDCFCHIHICFIWIKIISTVVMLSFIFRSLLYLIKTQYHNQH